MIFGKIMHHIVQNGPKFLHNSFLNLICIITFRKKNCKWFSELEFVKIIYWIAFSNHNVCVQIYFFLIMSFENSQQLGCIILPSGWGKCTHDKIIKESNYIVFPIIVVFISLNYLLPVSGIWLFLFHQIIFILWVTK